MIHSFTSVGPSKLDLLLAQLPDICDESKQKVILLTDINRLAKLLYSRNLTPKEFYTYYEYSIETLECSQHNLQVEYNTQQYRASIQGHDF